MFPELETDRLLLRAITKVDVEEVYGLFSNKDLLKYYGQEPFIYYSQAEKLVEHFSKVHLDKQGIRWGIERKEMKGIIGTIGFHNWVPKNHRAEIGYEIHPDYWRKGYMAEAINQVITYGFEQMELNRIAAIVFLENDASNRMLKKFGFEQEGILREYIFQNGKVHDTYLYSLLKNIQEGSKEE